jgi:signal transduction histidine kinase
MNARHRSRGSVGAAVATAAHEPHELDDRLLHETMRLARANAELDSFAGAVAHELRSPLKETELALAALVDRSGGDQAASALAQVRRMQALVGDLLGYARGDAFRRDQVDVATIVAEVLADLAEPIRESRAVVGCGRLPLVAFAGGPLRIVLRNLVENAIRAAVPRRPRIEILAREDATGWTIAVRDNGRGIDRRDLPFLFEGLGSRSHGAGIGLPLCKRILERGGGSIRVAETGPTGTTFSFRLPKEP